MIKRFKQLSKKYYYDKEAADYVIDWIERLHHIEGEWAGTNFILADFQKDDIIKPVFGLKEHKGGPRLIKECYIEIPKKNGKTTLLAAIELFLMLGDGEPGAQVYNCAGDDSQAELLFRTAKHMLIDDDQLASLCKILRTEIHYKNRYIKKLTSKADTKHGLNAHAVIYDELHAAQIGTYMKHLNMQEAQRRSPLFFQITTAGFDKTSICWDRHEYTETINKGIKENDQFWGVIYAADKEADPYISKTWEKANPIWNYSPTFQSNFQKDAAEAKNNITVLNAFKRLRLNVWTSSEIKWIDDRDWAKGNGEIPELLGERCYGGLDLASRSDTASFILTFPFEGKYYMKTWVFVPEEQIYRRDQKNEGFYFKWANEGHLIRTAGDTIDYRYIEDVVLDCQEKYNLISIGFDPYNSYQLIMRWIEEHDLQMVEYRQGWKTMSNPTKEFESLLKDGKIIHGGHPVLRWMADNAVCIQDNNDNYRIAKGKISKDKVDGIVAAIISIGECIEHREKEQEIYVGTW